PGMWSVTCLFIVAACQPAAPPPAAGPLAGTSMTFSVSLAEEERSTIRTLLQRFEQDTGVRVTLVSVTSDDLPQKLRVEVGAGRPTIDLFAQDNLSLRALVDADLVEDLSGVSIPEAVLPPLRPPRFGGRQYFLPFRPNVQVTYVNRARLAQAGVAPPTTVEELRAVARRLKAAAGGIPKVTLSLAQGGAAAVTVAEWIVAFGGDPLRLDDEGSVRAFEFLQGLWRENLLAKESLLAKYDTQVDYLQGETAWLAANWPFTSMVFAEQDLLDRFQVYQGWRGPARAAHVVGGDVLGVPRGVTGRRRQAALALAHFLMSREAQAYLAERNAWPSIRGDAYSAVPDSLRDTFVAVERALADGWYRPSVPHWPDVSDAMNDAVRRILERGEPPRPVLDALAGTISEAARRRGLTSGYGHPRSPLALVDIGRGGTPWSRDDATLTRIKD
ncbi:MAG: ABC transporter substrate-binding protein, partial [Candidatus Rokuibacteriota bacterium]